MDTLAERMAWGRMRMSPVDLADVTVYTYTYLMNGHSPDMNWTAIFNPGETIRLRFINSSSMTNYDVRIPGLNMEVVMADGKAVRPVSVHEFRIGVAETYDVLVRPKEDRAFTLFVESLDRSGYTRGTLAPEPGMEAAVPTTSAAHLKTGFSRSGASSQTPRKDSHRYSWCSGLPISGLIENTTRDEPVSAM